MRGTALHPGPGFEEADRMQKFWTERYAEFKERYPDQFVAVSRKTAEVLAANEELVLLLDGLRARGIDPRTEASVEFVAAGERNLFL